VEEFLLRGEKASPNRGAEAHKQGSGGKCASLLERCSATRRCRTARGSNGLPVHVVGTGMDAVHGTSRMESIAIVDQRGHRWNERTHGGLVRGS